MGFINQFPYSDFHELNLDWLLAKTKDLISRMTTIEEEFAKIEVLTEEQIRSMINSAIATNNIYLLNELNNMHAQITNEYTGYVNGRINQLKTYLDNQDVYYDNLAKSYAENSLIQAKAYTDSSVLDYTMMINPITGQYEDVRNVVDDIVMYFHTENSLTADEYDTLDLTATYYDSKDLTAYDYDFNGKLRLP